MPVLAVTVALVVPVQTAVTAVMAVTATTPRRLVRPAVRAVSVVMRARSGAAVTVVWAVGARRRFPAA